MKKAQARAQLARLASSKGLNVRFTLGNKVERVTILNSSHKPVATGQMKLTATGDYSANDFISIKASIAQVKTAGTKPAKKTLNSGTSGSVPKPFSNADSVTEAYNVTADEAALAIEAYANKDTEKGYQAYAKLQKAMEGDANSVDILADLAACFKWDDKLNKRVSEILSGKNASRRTVRKGNKLNCAEDVDYEGDDAEFVDDVAAVVQDQDGNEVVVGDMLIVQDPDTSEISLFIPDDTDDTVPESVEVIGEVVEPAADSLESSKMNCSDDVEDPAGDLGESVVAVVDENGESVIVNDILVVQDDKSSEINVFVPEDGAELPDGVTVIGEVLPSDDATVLDSSRRSLKRGARLNAAKAKPARKQVKTNCSTSQKLSAADQEKILGLFSKAGVKVTSSFDDMDTYDGVAYNLFCVETENMNATVLGYLQSDLRELESQDIGYEVEEGPNGFYSKTYQFYYYEDEDLDSSKSAPTDAGRRGEHDGLLFRVYFTDKKDGGGNQKLIEGTSESEVRAYMESLGHTDIEIEPVSWDDYNKPNTSVIERTKTASNKNMNAAKSGGTKAGDDAINKVVDAVVQLYMDNDYEFVKQMSMKGERPLTDINDPEAEVKFLERNGLVDNTFSYEDKLKIAKLSLKRIKELDEGLWNKYNSSRNKSTAGKPLNASVNSFKSLLSRLDDEDTEISVDDALYIELGDGSYIYASVDLDGGYLATPPMTEQSVHYTEDELIAMILSSWK